MQNYEYVATIGEGAYGEVWKCRDRTTGRVVAVKGFKQAHQDKLIMRLAVREAKILGLINHSNLVKMVAAFKSRTGRVYLVFEYVESSVHDHLERYPFGLPALQAKVVTWQLLAGLAYLHENRIIHRDIKPANILVSSQGVVKLCDFGFARCVQSGVRQVERCTSYITTRWYRAPEVLLGDHYGPSADIWSVGCTIAEIATGRPLFPGESTPDQLWRIIRCLGPPTLHQASLMALDPALHHMAAAPPAVQKTLRQRLPELEPRLFELVEACLVLDPLKRPTARELMHWPYFGDVAQIMASTRAGAIPLRSFAARRSAGGGGAAAAASHGKGAATAAATAAAAAVAPLLRASEAGAVEAALAAQRAQAHRGAGPRVAILFLGVSTARDTPGSETLKVSVNGEILPAGNGPTYLQRFAVA